MAKLSLSCLPAAPKMDASASKLPSGRPDGHSEKQHYLAIIRTSTTRYGGL